MASLWGSRDLGAWQAELSAYPDRVKQRENPELEKLDRAFRVAIPASVEGRTPPHLGAAELVDVVDWKLKRGKFRPRLLDFVKAHSESLVVGVSTKAFQLAAGGDVQGAIEELATLKGVGPATASAALSAFTPAAPFMSDEAVAACLTGPKEYTTKRYMQYHAAMSKKARDLKAGGGDGMSLRDMERALWSEAAKSFVPKKPKPGAKGGKGTDGAASDKRAAAGSGRGARPK
eukprot:CAMPEP_0182887340 /NCGR_PEP_ID=MMETSP0034_2-20130328/20770_1 /TAXON_ID=156128 /ORGANISM="Nephroselmis pyriformis, Strain CCMP717" /LENGTH=231 /DNA_ID=CAMNT_0025020705 /DNA_START=57 /DNA_END=749 /DNA_ORIENTATION=-